MRRRICLAILVGAYWLARGAAGAEAESDSFETPVQTVEVSGQASTVLMRYKHLLAGLDAFERNSAMAPTGKLTLRLFRNDASVSTKGVLVELVGNGWRKRIALAANGGFTVERDALALAEDADLVVNRKKSAFSIQPQINSADVAPGSRRLGDLRLECKVMVAIEHADQSFFGRLASGVLPECSRMRVTPPKLDTGRFIGYVMRDGERVAYSDNTRVDLDTRGVLVPLKDTSWSNDSIVKLEKMPKKVAPAVVE